MIAALYVQARGCYTDVEGVDPWDEARDARAYPGPWPVVAHPPCKRWGKFWNGGPSSPVKYKKGDDGGCFESALASVRRFGGVLEHPEASAAWAKFGLNKPPQFGSWVPADDIGGWTCYVEQGHYGHRARKPTWLYYIAADGSPPPALITGPSVVASIVGNVGGRGGSGGQMSKSNMAWLGKKARAATPPAFRDVLLTLARFALTIPNRLA